MRKVNKSSASPPDLTGLLTAAEAADFLGMTYHQLAQRRQRQKGPSYCVWMGRIYYARHALDAWQREHAKIVKVAA